jgi:CheY-like chemotaxis protein/AraC-like DNA-binding protein
MVVRPNDTVRARMTSRQDCSAVAGGDLVARPPAGPTVLLIDDDEGSLQTWRLLLAHGGFEVDQARSGAVGLALARRAVYDVVVLDLRLPDMTGLTLLMALRGRGIDTPVLIVTGFATHESTAQAFRLGVADVLEKPIGEELVAAVRRVVEQARRSAAGSEAEGLSGASRAQPSVRDLVARFEETAAGVTAEDDGAFVAALVGALLHPEIHVRSFLPGAQALREAIAAHVRQTLSHRIGHIARQFTHALQDHGPLPPTIAETIARLDRAVRTGQNPIHEAAVAKELGLHPTHLGRLIKLHTGVGFRQLRRLLRARRALLLVATSEEQLAQIAYAVGYAHASQLDRDFRHLFGVQPGWIRRCVQVSSTIRK